MWQVPITLEKPNNLIFSEENVLWCFWG